MKKYLVTLAWALSGITATLAIITWLQSIVSPFSQLTVYDIFPVFGLLAFSLMWCHYIVSALRTYYDVAKDSLKLYYSVTASIVLGAILLHPGLLTWQMWHDKAGLPVNYVAPDLRMYVILGGIAFLAFMAFELHRFYRQRSWWHYVERASDIAMFLILIHAYHLGRSLLPGWFRYVWFFYGFTLVVAIAYATKKRRQTTGRWL